MTNSNCNRGANTNGSKFHNYVCKFKHCFGKRIKKVKIGFRFSSVTIKSAKLKINAKTTNCKSSPSAAACTTDCGIICVSTSVMDCFCDDSAHVASFKFHSNTGLYCVDKNNPISSASVVTISKYIIALIPILPTCFIFP